MTLREWTGRELSGYSHQLIWMPGKVKLGRLFAVVSLGLFAAVLIWGGR